MPDKKNEVEEVVEAPKKYRVLHFAVSGVAKNRKGESVPKDFTHGKTVTSADLDGEELHYLSMGAIEEV